MAHAREAAEGRAASEAAAHASSETAANASEAADKMTKAGRCGMGRPGGPSC